MFLFVIIIMILKPISIHNQNIKLNMTEMADQNFFLGFSPESNYSVHQGVPRAVGLPNIFQNPFQNLLLGINPKQAIGNGPPPIFVPLPPQKDWTQIVLPFVKQKEGFIQGTGQFQCYLQGASPARQFVQNMGYYRCTFRGARKVRGFIDGIGYYQLIFQVPGGIQEFIQGVGIYQCNFQGVRHFHGFVTSMGQPIVRNRDGTVSFTPGIASKTAFFDIMGQYYSDLGDMNRTYRNPGRLQLLAYYQHDTDGLGQHPNFGSLQAVEFYNMDLTLLDLGPDDEKNYRQQDYLAQQGELQYSFQGNEITSGLINLVGFLAYNFQLDISEDETFFVFLGRYNYDTGGPGVFQNLDDDDDHDFLQVVGSYSLDYPRGQPPLNQSHIQVIATYQFDNERGQADFMQLVAQYQQKFPGLDLDQIYVELLGTYQKRFQGGTAKEFVELIGEFSYTLKGQGRDAGYFQLYGVYDYMPYDIPSNNGYLQYLLQYAFIYQGRGQNFFDLQLQLQYQFNFPDEPPYVMPNHGYCQIMGKWKIDLFLLGLEKKPSFLQLVFVFQCNLKGDLGHTDRMCFIQIFTLIQSDADGVQKRSKAYTQLLGQYYEEL